MLNGAKVGEGAIVGAGAVVTEGCEIPAGHLAVGVPAKVIRELTDADIERTKRAAEPIRARPRKPIAIELESLFRSRGSTNRRMLNLPAGDRSSRHNCCRNHRLFGSAVGTAAVTQQFREMSRADDRFVAISNLAL